MNDTSTTQTDSNTGNTNNDGQSEKQSATALIKELVITIAQVLIAVFVIRMCIVEPFKIPSTSMEPTLLVGDHILVNKLSYGVWPPIPFRKNNAYQFSTPKRGDVIVFTRNIPKNALGENENEEEDLNLIKRVIGLPGDTVKVSGTKVFINGKELEEPWNPIWTCKNCKQLNFPSTVVPEGHVFMMGDNRDNSRDSRVWSEHFVPINHVKGRAFFIYWSSGIWQSMKYFERFGIAIGDGERNNHRGWKGMVIISTFAILCLVGYLGYRE